MLEVQEGASSSGEGSDVDLVQTHRAWPVHPLSEEVVSWVQLMASKSDERRISTIVGKIRTCILLISDRLCVLKLKGQQLVLSNGERELTIGVRHGGQVRDVPGDFKICIGRPRVPCCCDCQL